MEQNEDRALRPLSLSEFLGQEESKRSLDISIRAAKTRNEALDHVLLSGPPGLGKTTLAQIIAREMGSRLVIINAPSIKTKGDLAAVLVGLGQRDVLFIDEIHGLHPRIEEILYSAMEDYELSVITGQGALAEAVNIPISPFTLIGATTKSGMMSQPLRDRFGEIIHMQFYTERELSTIVSRNAAKLGVLCDDEAALEIARRSRGTPRVANRIVRRARDHAQNLGNSLLSLEIVKETCELMGIDALGLDRITRRYLDVLVNRRVAVGVEALAAVIGEDKSNLEEAIEPYLMRIGFVERTPKGRIATSNAIIHMRS